MLTKEAVETRLAGLRKQQQAESAQALMLEGAIQFCAQLLRELTAETKPDDPTFS